MAGDKFIGLKVIWLTTFVLIAYYLHELFEFVYIDVLHLDLTIWGVHLTSLIPFHPYDEGQQLDLQVYVWELGVYIMFLLMTQMLYNAVYLLNILDNPIPGYHDDSLRLMKGLRYFFASQILFFLFFHGQQDEVYDLLVIIVCFVTPHLRRTLPQRIQDVQK